MAYATCRAHLEPPQKHEVFVGAFALQPLPVAAFVGRGASPRVSAAVHGIVQPSIYQRLHPSLLSTLKVVMMVVAPNRPPNF